MSAPKKIQSKPIRTVMPTPEDVSSNKPHVPIVSLGRLMTLVVIISIIVGGISGALFATSDVFSSLRDSLSGVGSQQNELSNVDTKTVSVVEDSQTIDVVHETSDSVVSIIITKDFSQYYSSSPFDDFLYQFNNQQNGVQEIGGGSGFIIGEDGLIVTNKHVISDPDAEYTVVLNNRETYSAQVIAVDPLNDIAFVKIETDVKLPVLTLGDSDTLQIGQTVITIGNALGEYRNTVTRGIVSGLARTVVAGDGQGMQETLENVIQTDAAINPGNSGGPLLNLSGQVIGVNTAINLEGQLIGFAIPINQVREAIDSVKENGRVIRPMLGVRYVSVTKDIAEQNDLPVEYGALLVSGSSKNQPAVIKDSSADRAGLVEDDIILEINGEKIEGDNSLSRLVQKYSAGDEITLKYLHEGEEQTAKVTLDELPAE